MSPRCATPSSPALPSASAGGIDDDADARRREQDHEAIDFTDNDITSLANFPLSPRLHTLLCARNRIASLAPGLAKSLPNLHTLVLTQNNIAELADLDPLQGCAKLTHVALLDNPVTGKEVRSTHSPQAWATKTPG